MTTNFAALSILKMESKTFCKVMLQGYFHVGFLLLVNRMLNADIKDLLREYYGRTFICLESVQRTNDVEFCVFTWLGKTVKDCGKKLYYSV